MPARMGLQPSEALRELCLARDPVKGGQAVAFLHRGRWGKTGSRGRSRGEGTRGQGWRSHTPRQPLVLLGHGWASHSLPVLNRLWSSRRERRPAAPLVQADAPPDHPPAVRNPGASWLLSSTGERSQAGGTAPPGGPKAASPRPGELKAAEPPWAAASEVPVEPSACPTSGQERASPSWQRGLGCRQEHPEHLTAGARSEGPGWPVCVASQVGQRSRAGITGPKLGSLGSVSVGPSSPSPPRPCRDPPEVHIRCLGVGHTNP